MLSTLSVGLVSMLALADPLAAPAASSAPSVSPAHYLLLNAPDRRVRATDARLRSLVAEGLHRSRTFAGLVTALNRSDVIVYIESVMMLPKGTDGPPDDDAAAQVRIATCASRFAPTCRDARPSRSSGTSCNTPWRSPARSRCATPRP